MNFVWSQNEILTPAKIVLSIRCLDLEVWGRVGPDPWAELQVNPAQGPQLELGRPGALPKGLVQSHPRGTFWTGTGVIAGQKSLRLLLVFPK